VFFRLVIRHTIGLIYSKMCSVKDTDDVLISKPEHLKKYVNFYWIFVFILNLKHCY